MRYAECDPQGVVFNANYLAYMDIGITELWRAAFGGYQVMLDRGIDLVVVQTELRFYTPARFDDQLQLEVTVTGMGNTSISSAHRILKVDGSTGEIPQGAPSDEIPQRAPSDEIPQRAPTDEIPQGAPTDEIPQGEELVVEGSIHHVVVDRQTLSKTAIPDWVRAALEPWAAAAPD